MKKLNLLFTRFCVISVLMVTVMFSCKKNDFYNQSNNQVRNITQNNLKNQSQTAKKDPLAYIANYGSNTVSVINTVTDTVISTIPVGSGPYGVAISPDGSTVYVTNAVGNSVSVINTTSNIVIATIAVGSTPQLVAVS